MIDSMRKIWLIPIALIGTCGTCMLLPGIRKGAQDVPQVERRATPAQVELHLPQEQAAFVEAALGFAGAYEEAPNELKKSALRAQRAQALERVLGKKMRVSGWVGRLRSMGTTGQGQAHIEIEAQGVKFKTWNNALSDVGDRTLIAQDSPVYAQVADMTKGDVVEFTGTFMRSSQDHVKEASISEAGSMTAPEFILRFEAISRLR